MATPLTGRGKFETIAQDDQRFHIRQSSLTEATLATYILTAAGIVVLLALIGLDVVRRPSVTWAFVISAPALAFWVLRHSTDLVADRTLDRLVLRVRRVAFIEDRFDLPLSRVARIEVSRAVSADAVEGMSVTIVDREGTPTPLALDIPPGIAMRIAKHVGTLAQIEPGVPPTEREDTGARRNAHEASRAAMTSTPTAPIATPAAPEPATAPAAAPTTAPEATLIASAAPPVTPPPDTLPEGSAIRAVFRGSDFVIEYPTRSTFGGVVIGGVSLITLLLGCISAAIGWGVIWHAGPTIGRLLMLALAIVMTAIGITTLHAAVALLIGGEQIIAGARGLSIRTMIAGFPTASHRWDWTEVKSIRAVEGLRILTDELPFLAAGTLSQAECDWLAATIWTRRTGLENPS